MDDHDPSLRLTQAVLRKAGPFEVCAVQSAEAALQAMTQFRPQLVLTDIALPGMNGLDFARVLRSSPDTRGVRIVALTAYAMHEDRQRALAAGCDGYISKPFDLAGFGGRLMAYLEPDRRGAAPPGLPPDMRRTLPPSMPPG